MSWDSDNGDFGVCLVGGSAMRSVDTSRSINVLWVATCWIRGKKQTTG